MLVLDGILDAFQLASKRGIDSGATRRRVEDLRARLDALRTSTSTPPEAA